MNDPIYDVTVRNGVICVWLIGEPYPLLEMDEAEAADVANRIQYALDEIKWSGGR